MELLKFSDDHSIHQTVAWVVAGKDAGLESIDVLIDPPPPGTPSLAVYDLKAWLLSEKQTPRLLELKDQKPESKWKKATAPAVFAGYVRAVLRRAGFQSSDTRSLHLLMPAFGADDDHFRYLKALTTAVHDAVPKASVDTLSEPEMVLEFFRIVKGLVRLRPGANSFFLVVDAGASTTNFTIVMSTRAGQITEATKRRRLQNLRPVSFNAALFAGHALDHGIIDRLAPDLKDASEDVQQDAVVRAEAAKLEVARTQADAAILLPTGETVMLTPAILGDMTKWLWSNLASSYQGIAKLLIEQLQSGASEKIYGPILVERGIKAPGDVGRLFDAVFLAGGTSRLPGFEEELRATIQLPRETPIHSIGGAYPVAAAVGGLAHILMPRRESAEADPVGDTGGAGGEDDSEFTRSLAWNVVLDCQDRQRKPSNPSRVVVLHRSHPVARLGGEVSFALPHSWNADSKARARLVPSLSDAFESERLLRRGMGFEKVLVKRAGGTGEGTYDAQEQRLTIRSNDAPGLAALHFLGEGLAAAPNDEFPRLRRTSTGGLDIRKSMDVVIDIGMSKTVIAHAPRAQTVRHDAFDRIERETPGKLGFANSALVRAVPPDTETVLVGPPEPSLPAPTTSLEEDMRPPTVSDGGVPTEQAQPLPAAQPAHVDAPVTPEPGASPSGPVVVLPPPAALPHGDEDSRNQEPSPEAAPTSIILLPAQPRVPNRPRELKLQSPLELSEPAARIRKVADAAHAQGIGIDARQLALAYLALCTRRFVLLAGPPGSGKSTLARMLARTLGCARGDGFTDLSVQAHWVDDAPLFGREGALEPLLDGPSDFHLVLFDEINLTRPEYFLSRMFGALDHHGAIGGKKLPPVGLVGTLNIDDFSRPPSPKVLDRAMLLVVDSHSSEQTTALRCAWEDIPDRDRLGEESAPERRAAIGMGEPTPEARHVVDAWVHNARIALRNNRGMRADLIPSRRAVQDLLKYAALHRALELSSIITESEALDQAILGRFISPLSGPEVEVRPLIDAWRSLCDELPTTLGRLERLLKQVENHGFASFWQ